jgi:hypothetical protein
VSPDVCELVGKDRIDLRGAQPGHRRHRQKNDRPHPADDRRCVDVRGIRDDDGPEKSQPRGDPLGSRLPSRRRLRKAETMETADMPAAAGQPQYKDRYPRQPDQHEAGQRLLGGNS